MNLEFTADGFDGFALQPQSAFESPAMVRRLAELAADLAANPPPVAQLVTPPVAVKAPFHLSPAELAKIDRNLARLSQFSTDCAPMF